MKKCSKCSQEKDDSCFHKDSGNPDGLRPNCKLCRSKAIKLEPKKQADYRYRNNYGITFEQVKQMFIAQNGKCAICDREFKNKKTMCMDHDHKTGQVRQLLCKRCNTAIGVFHDDIKLISKALNYLLKWTTV